jgi:hypothetical protein
MTKVVPRHALRGGCVLCVFAALAGCGTPPPTDFGGEWQAVNRYQATTAEIPLAPAYLFQATPIDGTLKTMLERWARDSSLKLSYRLGSDFTLHQPVTRIRTADLRAAASELSAIYASQGVSVAADGAQILVQPIAVSQPATTTEK